MTNREIDDTVHFNQEDLDFLQQDKFEVAEDIIYSGRKNGSFLVFVTGPDRGNVIGIYKEKMVIGRDRGSDIVINKQYVSKSHAEILAFDNKTVIVDYGSTNGTRLNDVPVKRAELKDKDEIKIGNVILKYYRIDLHTVDPDPVAPAFDDTAENKFYRQVFNILKPHFGPMTTQFLNRQIKAHVGKTPQTLSISDKETLARWINISTGLLLDDTIAQKLADQVLSLK